MKLAASLIVKNELGRYLQACIGSLREFCDLVVVLDDGSTDRTGEWLDDNADEQMVVLHLIPDDAFFAGHEGRRRQALLDFTLDQDPDWVLAIDADEFVANGQAVRQFMETPHPMGTLLMQEVWEVAPDRLSIRQDGGWKEHPVPILWKVPGVLDARWAILDRALACGREPVAVRNMRGRSAGTEVLHFGWADPATRQERYDRYAVADGGRFHANRHLESILWDDSRVQLTTRRWPEGLRDRLG